MNLTRQQLESVLRDALPQASLQDAEAHGADYALRLHDGRILILRCYAPDTAEIHALRLLAAEVDLPLPQLVASGEAGGPLTTAYALLAPVGGEPLSQVLPHIGEGERYTLGRRLGQIMARVHSVRVPRFGVLGAEDGGAGESERAYVLARLDQAIAACGSHLSTATARNLHRWFDQSFVDTRRPPLLVHGSLSADRVLVQRSESQWRISGLLGWGSAQGWSPGWDHAILIVNAADAALFSFRVGYGEAYDEANQRAYEQVRELALAPYRLLLSLDRVVQRPDEAQRYVRLIDAMLAALLVKPGDDERFSSALSA